MTKLNGQGAEIMIKKVLKELGFLPKTPVSYEEVMKEIESTNIPHFNSAMYHIENIYKTYDVPVDIVLDYAYGVDCFFEAEDGNIVSLDVTVNGTTSALNHKANVQHWTANSRKRLGLTNHLIVVIDTEKNWTSLTEDDKWMIIDKLEEAYASNKEEVLITI